MAKFFKKFQFFLQYVYADDRGVAGTGPVSVLAGIGVLGLSFILLTSPGMMDRQIAQPVSTTQEDPLVQAVQQAVQLGQKEESERACIYWRIDKHGHFTTTLSRRDFY